MKHLSAPHASTKLVAKNTVIDTVDDDSRPGVAIMSSEDMELSQQLKLDFSAPASKKTCATDWTELNDRQVCCGEHAPVISSWLRLLQSPHEYWGEQVPVLLYATGLWNPLRKKILIHIYTKKSNAIVTFPGN